MRRTGQHRRESPFAEAGRAFAAALAEDSRFRGEVDARKVTRSLYASNASICMLMPAAVATPSCAEDVVRIVRAAAAHGLPVTPRGAGSSVAGQSLGEGVIVDFSPKMNRLLELDTQARTVRLEPGMIRNRLDEALQPSGLWFPPNPSSGGFCTIGGMIATNSGGSHSLKYGTTRHYLVELELVLADGSYCTVRAPQRTVQGPSPGAPAGAAHASPSPSNGDEPAVRRAQELAALVREILAENHVALAEERPQSLRNSCGYNLFEAETPEGLIDLTRILCGSEGTLGIIVAATLQLLARPTQKRGVMLAFADEQSAFSAVPPLTARFQPATVQCLPRSLLDLAAAHGELEDAQGWLTPELATLLLVELDGSESEAASLEEAAQRLATELAAPQGPAYRVELARTPAQLDALWRVRRSAAALLWRLPGEERPTRWIEDGAVPPERLPEFVAGLRELFAEHGIDAALFGHAGQGLLHFSPRLDPHAPGVTEQLQGVGAAHAQLVRALGGVVSGEHGDGLLRTPYLPAQFPRSYPAFEATKTSFDPDWRLNPLVIVPRPERRGYESSAFLRYDESYQPATDATEGALDQPPWHRAVESCHGCGSCRQYCPVVALGDEEAHLPRAKANLVRGLLSGSLTLAEAFEGDDGREVADFCLSCGLCLSHCPSQVDIPGISALYHEARRRYHGGEAAGEALLGEWLRRPDRLMRLGNLAAPVANAGLALRPVRDLMQALTGIAADAPLPRFGGRRRHGKQAFAGHTKPNALPVGEPLPPGSLAPPQGFTRPDGRPLHAAAIFVPCDARGAEDQTVADLVELLEALGLSTQRIAEAAGAPCCGRPLESAGYREEARELLGQHRRWLHEQAADDGRVVVVPSVSCLAPLRREAEQLGVSLYDGCELLLSLLRQAPQLGERAASHTAGKLVALHTPCSARAAGVAEAAPDLLCHLGFQVERVGGACCGALGTYSLLAANQENAQAIGEATLRELGNLPTHCATSTSDNCCRWLGFRLSLDIWHATTIALRSFRASGQKIPS